MDVHMAHKRAMWKELTQRKKYYAKKNANTHSIGNIHEKSTELLLIKRSPFFSVVVVPCLCIFGTNIIKIHF